MKLDISLQHFQVSQLIIILNLHNPLFALPTLHLKPIFILFSALCSQWMFSSSFTKELSTVLLSHTVHAISVIKFGLMKIIIFCKI